LGHIAQHHNSINVPNGFKFEGRVYDESVLLSEGAIVFRNTHLAVWTGELAEQIKAELVRRSDIVRGKAEPRFTKNFTGLVICSEY
jgi:hypothetical protein